MGQADQFAKRKFASDAEQATHGGVAWEAAAEIGLVSVQADGLLRVKDPARLVGLAEPWQAAGPHTEIQMELKMPGDHLDAPVFERGLLRRQARQVERMEDEAIAPPWRGQQPLWWAAPHVPKHLRERHELRCFAPGCYRVDTGAKGFELFWIAANELPLCEELIPFLVVRSGPALDAFGRWVADYRPADWVLDVVEYTTMSITVQDELLERFEEDPEARLLAKRRLMAASFLKHFPELGEDVRRDVRLDIQRDVERSALRDVLTTRGLAMSAEDDARIDACTDVDTLKRWLHNAITASSTADALR